jgi:hypothetical protein
MRTIKITRKQLKRLISENIQMDEIGYEEFHSLEKLEKLRDAIDKNKTVSVAFVKKDGTVRHMAIRKNLSSYEASDRPKSEKQLNVQVNNNIKRVIDINAYIKNKRETGDPAGAAKSAWRTINLETILGFLAGGKFYDLREENDILNKFGDQVYNSLTKSMVNAMEREAQENEAQIEESINEGEGFFGNFGRWFNKPTAKDAAKDALRSKGYSEMGRDDESGDENSYYTVFNGEKFYPNQIEYADNNDLGEIPRVENGKLIIANPMWRE